MDHTYEVSSVIIVIKVLYWYDFLLINGYKFIRRDRGKGRGGGILIYIKAELLHKVVSNLLPDYAEQVKAKLIRSKLWKSSGNSHQFPADDFRILKIISLETATTVLQQDQKI